jgi:O-antigen/teichoic acid export membrane protein
MSPLEGKYTTPLLAKWQAALGGVPQPLRRLLAVLSGQGARQGYLAAADQSVISTANFLATLVLANNASPTEVGVYSVGFTSLRLVRAVQEGITIQPLNTYGAGMDEGSFRAYATSTSLIQIFIAISAALAAAIGGWILTRLGNDTAGPGLFSLWSAFLWWQLQEYIRRMLYTRGRAREATLNSFLANAIRLGMMVWLAGQGRLDGIGSLHAIALGSLAALIPGLWQTRDYWSLQFENLPQTWRRNWGFGRWIAGGLIANWIAVEFYPVLTAGMISFAAAGAYRVLQNLVAPIHLLLRAVDTFLTPRAARDFQSNGRPALSRALRLTYLLVGLPVSGFLGLAILFPTPLLRLLYGETYLPYSEGMVLMAVFYALMFVYWPPQTAFKAIGASRPIFIANLAAILAMFTAGLWMIRQWGVFGTIGGQALNALIIAVVLWVSWRNNHSTRIFKDSHGT